MNPRVTLMDVARRAGVNLSSVSRALHNSPQVSAASREKIQALAKEMGYRPDPAFSFLVAQRWHKKSSSGLAMAVIMETEGTKDGLLEKLAFDAASTRAEELGYRMEFFGLDKYPSAARLGGILKARGIRGLILHANTNLRFPADFDWQPFCVLDCGSMSDKCPFFRVINNPSRAIYDIMEQLLRRGYRRPGAALWDIPGSDIDRRIIGSFLQFQDEFFPKKSRIPPLLFRGEELAREVKKHKNGDLYPSPRLEAYLKKWRPDAVIGLHDFIYWLLKAGGWRMPEEIGFTTAALTYHIKLRNPEMYGVEQQQLGKTVVDQLDLLLRTSQNGVPPRRTTTLVDPVFLDYETIRPAG